MSSIMGEFYRVLGAATEINLKQDDAAAKRAVAVREANTLAQMRAVSARHAAQQPTPPVPVPNTDINSVGDPNALPGGGTDTQADMAGMMAQMGGDKKPTLFGESKHPGLTDTAAELRELGNTLIMGGDYKTGRQFIADSVKAEAKAAEIDTEELQQQVAMSDMLGAIAGSVHDQQSYTNALMIGAMHGMDVTSIFEATGGEYNAQAQEILDQFTNSTLSVKEQAQGQIANAKLANDNKRTQSLLAAREVSIAKNRQAMGIARERLNLSKEKPGKAPKEIKEAKKSVFDETMEDAGIPKGSADYIKAARIKAKLEKGAGGGSTADVISELLAEPSPTTVTKASVLDPPDKKVEAEDEESRKAANKIIKSSDRREQGKPATFGYSEDQIEATMKKYGKSRAEVLAAIKAKSGK